IISADSVQVYRHMDVGTDKPDPSWRRRVPHHLVDILDPDEEFNVALFQRWVFELVPQIRGRGRIPLLVGGSPLYVYAVVDRYLFPAGGQNPAVRAGLMAEAARRGPLALHRRLAEVDPESAARIHPHNVRRVVRALEVFHLTGQPISRLQGRGPEGRVAMFGLTRPRPSLYRHIEERVDRMLARGLVEEVRRLLAMGYGPELRSMQALGYKEVAAYLRGEVTLEEAVRLIKRNTKRFAKRQLSWFGRDTRIRWLDVDALGGPPGAARAIASCKELSAVAGEAGRPSKL
ncbi:MAG: tRNA (adenosine(37)-N6)-dimethylallyltransferase MiaA, partial [Firmicutes bacterium]|nr:tRNA (adenosine(37)-N6)-dimethylallyltransferase MiaA [Bacillota bacterium]